MKISAYVNFVLNTEGKSELSIEECSGLDSFDDAVLILDDIQDDSSVRNGNPCYHVLHGIEASKEEARRLYKQSFETLGNIFKSRKLGFISRIKAKLVLSKLKSKIEKGQNIDKTLENKIGVNKRDIYNWHKMSKLFTGGHIRCGFQIGVLICDIPKKKAKHILDIGESIGVIRQIDDDINDYQQIHHEPLGDLIHHKKRLPELVFLLISSNEEIFNLEKYLQQPTDNLLKIKQTIFSPKVIEGIRGLVKTEESFIEKNIFLVDEKYKTKLKNLMQLYIKSIDNNLST